jgi:hypothetical protein
MIVTWAIVYLDRTDEQRRARERQFQDRHLIVDTDTLDPVDKAAVEFLVESRNGKNERDILKFRHLFREWHADEALPDASKYDGFALTNYVEDESGNELTDPEVAELLTGSPNAIRIPNGAETHDVEFMLSESRPMPVAEITLTTEQVKNLGYFCRDLWELANSAFLKEERAASLQSNDLPPGSESVVKTAVSDDEIRSFVTIFRRLYMKDERANFLVAAGIFATALGDHPLAKWVQGAANSYESKMEMKPQFCFGPFKFNLKRKRLIDIFLYTQYAHQPDERRQRQFGEYLREVGGRQSVLTWLFLSELWITGNQIRCAGQVVSRWFDRYCQHHKLTPDVLNSLLHEHPGIGSLEKEADRLERLLGEKTQELSVELWQQSGSPPAGPVHYLHQAHEQLTKLLQGSEVHERPGT